MKVLKIFSFFVLLQLALWAGVHWYQSANPGKVLIVVDTSYAMKTQFPEMQRWISARVASGRYQQFEVGTDKARMGNLSDLKSLDVLFRTVYGKISEDSLRQYQSSVYDQKILLSDGSIQPAGWDVEIFRN